MPYCKIFARIIKDVTSFVSDNIGLRGIELIIGESFIIDIPFQKIENFTPEQILNEIENYIQSNENVPVKFIQAKITTIYKNFTVGHGSKLKYKTELDSADNMLNVRSIPSYFYKPQARGCIFLALAYRMLKKQYDHPRVSKIEAEAKALAMICNINYDMDIGIQEIEQIENKLQIRLIVLKTEPTTKAVESFYFSKEKDIRKPLFQLLLHKQCFYSFTSFRNILLDSTYGRHGGICIHCNELVRNYTTHITACLKRCNACYFPASLCSSPVSPIDNDNVYDISKQQKCAQCHRVFFSEVCYNNHKKPLSEAMISHSNNKVNSKKADAYSICGKIRKCPNCNAIITDLNAGYNKSKHDCSQVYCNTCFKLYDPIAKNHVCYIEPKSFSKTAKSYSTTVYFDCETIVKSNQNNCFEAVVIVAQIVCTLCCNIDEENNDFVCTEGSIPCGKRTVIFKRKPGTQDNIVGEFIDWLLKLHRLKKLTEINVVSHNGSCFDNFIIFTHLIQRSDDIAVSPPIRKGSSVLSLTLENNINFKDSYLYLMMALSKLPQVFGFQNLVKREYFLTNF